MRKKTVISGIIGLLLVVYFFYAFFQIRGVKVLFVPANKGMLLAYTYLWALLIGIIALIIFYLSIKTDIKTIKERKAKKDLMEAPVVGENQKNPNETNGAEIATPTEEPTQGVENSVSTEAIKSLEEASASLEATQLLEPAPATTEVAQPQVEAPAKEDAAPYAEETISLENYEVPNAEDLTWNEASTESEETQTLEDDKNE